MTTLDDVPYELFESAILLGSELAQPGQSIEGAVDQLNINLAVIGCVDFVHPASIRGQWHGSSFEQHSDPFTRAVRATTSSLIFREDSIIPPAPPDNETLAELIDNSTEGAVWVDPDAAAHREKIAQNNGKLLRGFVGGLAAQGYAPAMSLRDMRAEFNKILDDLWSRSSYASFPVSKVVARTMRLSGARNSASVLRDAQRLTRFSRTHGIGLAIHRLLPEDVAAEL